MARRPIRHGMVYTLAWVYLHLLLFLGIVGTGAAILEATEFKGGDLPTNIRVLVTGSLGLFLVVIGLLELILAPSEEEPTHPRLSPGLKIVSGLLVPVVAMFPLSKLWFFWLFYPFLLVQMVYGAWTWFTQELPEPEGDALD